MQLAQGVDAAQRWALRARQKCSDTESRLAGPRWLLCQLRAEQTATLGIFEGGIRLRSAGRFQRTE
jgi:hypothetical protein